MENQNEWKQSNTHVFWGEMAPNDHLVQIYEDDEVVLDSLEGFVDSGLKIGDGVIVIAAPDHLTALNTRLIKQGYNLNQLRSTHQYIPIDAYEALSKFMINAWPDQLLFMKMVEGIIALARGNNIRRVRAYGEMVAILWAQGHNGATVQLEHLWNRVCQKEAFCLFCAYPKSGFTQDANTSIQHICSTHTKIISGLEGSTTEVFYKNV